jgi:hypothetical protein
VLTCQVQLAYTQIGSQLVMSPGPSLEWVAPSIDPQQDECQGESQGCGQGTGLNVASAGHVHLR